MEGKTVKFTDVYECGKYKNYTKVESEIVTPKEVFKLLKTPKANQFSFRIYPMKYWHKQSSVEARDTYLSSTDWSVALYNAGKTEKDLFPTLNKGDKIDFSKADMNVWYEIAPYMINSVASDKYHKIVYEMNEEYVSEVIHRGGEEPFSDYIDVLSQSPLIMEFLFHSVIKISEPQPEEEAAVK